jgi:hypothetical protein
MNKPRFQSLSVCLAVTAAVLLGACSQGSEGDQSATAPTESAATETGQTKLTSDLNSALQPGDSGVMIRSLPDFNNSPIVVGSFTRNDIEAPTSMFVLAPFCGADIAEYVNYSASGQPEGPQYPYREVCDGPDPSDRYGRPAGTDSYKLAAFGWASRQAVELTTDTYYFHDANFDFRCWQNPSGGDCEFWDPYGPAPANANTFGATAHGGQGCYYKNGKQVKAKGPDGVSLVQGKNCQCNLDLSGNDWNDWIDHWLKYANGQERGGTSATFFKGNQPDIPFNEANGKNAKAFQWQVDWSACWTSEIDDMVDLQNALWQRRGEWWNGLNPVQPKNERNLTSQKGQPYYWGWNEVPMKKEVDLRKNHDAWMIKLPAGMEKLNDLSKLAKEELRKAIVTAASSSEFKEGVKLKLNSPEQSQVVILREQPAGDNAWEREFFCQSFSFDKEKTDGLRIEYNSDGDGSCQLTGQISS